MGAPTWKETASRSAVTVQSTTTVLYGPVKSGQYDDECYVEALNDDAGQTLDAYVELATAEAGPWKRTAYEGLTGIGPGDAAHVKFDIRAYPWWRLTGVASGAGLDARVTVRILHRPV